MKKVLSITLSLVMMLSALSMMPASAFAYSMTGSCGENVTYDLNAETGELVISGSGTMYDYDSDNTSSFYYNQNITSIVINDGITTVGAHMFEDCQGVTSLTLGNYITEIKTFAFANLFALESLTLPESLTTIGAAAFGACMSLTSVTIPENVTSIDANPFPIFSNLDTIIVDSDNSVYDSRNNCNAIIETATNKLITGCKTTVIPSGVTTIDSNAFSYCTALTSINIPLSVTNINNSAFGGCTGLTDVYYAGSEAQWLAIQVGQIGNESLTEATIHFNSSTELQQTTNNGTSITIADKIKQNVYLDENYYGANSYVMIRYNHNSNAGQTPSVSTDILAMSELDKLNDPTSEYNGNRYFSVTQAPAQITESIVIKVFANQADAIAGTTPIDTIATSTYDYCRSIITGDYTQKLKALAKSTLDYAAAAQLMFNYNTGSMATKDNANNAFYGDVAGADFSGVDDVAAKPDCIEGVTAVIKSDLEINFLSKTPIAASSILSFATKGGKRIAYSNETNGDYYVIHISGIDAANMSTPISVTTDKGAINFTPNSIIKIMAGSEDTKLSTLAKALYLYGVAAENYFA